jgi:hypothetical protein
VPTCDELDRLAAARPPILRRTEEVMDQAEEDRLLHQILASATAPRQARGRTLGRGLVSPGRAGLLAAGIGLIAAAVAVAVVLPSGTTTVPGGPPAATRHGPAARTARQVLLAAALTAAAAPEGSGKYWYVKDTQSLQGRVYSVETWTPLHGRTWVRGNKMPGAPVGKLIPDVAGTAGQFSLADSDVLLRELEGLPPRMYRIGGMHFKHYRVPPGLVTLAQLSRLPASPAALLAWITDFDRKSARENGASAAGRIGVFESLTYLVATLPAPPQVRAAAFRAMAAMPGVTSLGPVHGGQGLRFPLGPQLSATVVVDPATSRVRDTLTVVGVGGEVSSDSVSAKWTNRLPK